MVEASIWRIPYNQQRMKSVALHVYRKTSSSFLKLQVPKYSWQHHQRELAARVLKRMEQQLQNITVLDLPTIVRDLLIGFKTFKQGD